MPPELGRGLPASGVVLFGFVLAGCTEPVSRLRIESHRPGEPPVVLSEDFERCFYGRDARGNVEIVLRSARPSTLDVDSELVQLVWARTFWRPVPGTTYAERTQTNATIGYALLDAGRGISYEGAGFVFFSEQPDGRIKGQIETATLAPGRTSGDAPELFGQCLVSGEFIAERSEGEVKAALTELRRSLGRPPRYRPGDPSRELR